jgi:hypothetical protein
MANDVPPEFIKAVQDVYQRDSLWAFEMVVHEGAVNGSLLLD